MKKYIKFFSKACSVALVCLALQSCNESESNVSLGADYRLSLSPGQDSLPRLEGTLIFSKELEQVANSHSDAVAAQDMDKVEDLYSKVQSIHEELMNSRALQVAMTGNNPESFVVMKATFDQIINQLELEFNCFNTLRVGDSRVQKSGDCSMVVHVDFDSRFEKMSTGLAFKTYFANIVASKVKIRIQQGLKEEYLDATIAHELGHLYFEILYPALAHSKRKTGYGFNEGKAISEGAALYVEKLYIVSKYKSRGAGLFARIHPSNRTTGTTNDDEKPYGDYLAYFIQLFTTDCIWNTELLSARNNSVCADYINEFAISLNLLKDWPTQYAACFYLNANNSIEGGHVYFSRKENTIESFVESDATITPQTYSLQKEIEKIEPDALAINNWACGAAITSIFSDADSVPLVVQAVDIIAEYSMATKGMCFFKRSQNAADAQFEQLSSVGDAQPGLLLNARMCCAPAVGVNLTASNFEGLDYEDVPSLIVNLMDPTYMRDSTIVHELSHLYMAKMFPMINSVDVREGYAVYMEYLYLKNIFRQKLQACNEDFSSETLSIMAHDFLRYKYSYTNISPSQTQEYANAIIQFTRLGEFVKNYISKDGVLDINALRALNNTDLNKKLQ